MKESVLVKKNVKHVSFNKFKQLKKMIRKYLTDIYAKFDELEKRLEKLERK